MTMFIYPGIYIEEVPAVVKPINGVAINTTVFIGMTQSGSVDDRLPITSFSEFEQRFGTRSPIVLPDGRRQTNYLAHAVSGFFANGGRRLYVVKIAATTLTAYAEALNRVGKLPDVGIVALPGYSALAAKEYSQLNQLLQRHAEAWHNRMILLDVPVAADTQQLLAIRQSLNSSYLALYTPWCLIREGRVKQATAIPPSGFIAGIYTRVDTARGVYKAPANELVQGIAGFERNITEQEQSQLNPQGINVLRSFPGKGHLVWGARTASADPEWKYIPVRRYAIYLEQSIEKGTQWTVFEPNAEPLWQNLRSAITDFLQSEWRQGALQGTKPEDAYFVRIDRTTMTQTDIDEGRVIVQIGFAPLKPAEFVILRIVLKTEK